MGTKECVTVYRYDGGYFDPDDGEDWERLGMAVLLDGGKFLFDRFDEDAILAYFLGDDLDEYTVVATSWHLMYDICHIYRGPVEVDEGDVWAQDRDADMILIMDKSKYEVVELD